jgi:hypothetical protein
MGEDRPTCGTCARWTRGTRWGTCQLAEERGASSARTAESSCPEHLPLAEADTDPAPGPGELGRNTDCWGAEGPRSDFQAADGPGVGGEAKAVRSAVGGQDDGSVSES